MEIAVQLVKLTHIRVAAKNVRSGFDKQQLNELAASIKERGILQPLVCRQTKNGLELIAGERRLRAARIAGLKEVPVIVREADDDEVIYDRLIENLQREDLSPHDQFHALKALRKRGFTVAKISKMTGLSTTKIDRVLVLESLIDIIRKRADITLYEKAFIAKAPNEVQEILAERVARDEIGGKQLGHDIMPAINEILSEKHFSEKEKREVIRRIARETTRELPAKTILEQERLVAKAPGQVRRVLAERVRKGEIKEAELKRDILPSISSALDEKVFSPADKEEVIQKIAKGAAGDRPARAILWQERGRAKLRREGADIEIIDNQTLRELQNATERYNERLLLLQQTRFQHLDRGLVIALVNAMRQLYETLGNLLAMISRRKS